MRPRNIYSFKFVQPQLLIAWLPVRSLGLGVSRLFLDDVGLVDGFSVILGCFHGSISVRLSTVVDTYSPRLFMGTAKREGETEDVPN